MVTYVEVDRARIARWGVIEHETPGTLIPHWRGVGRDSIRQKCYNWENKTLAPYRHVFTSRDAAKGYAKLCFKAALKVLVAKHKLNEEQVAVVKFTMVAAFTKVSKGYSDASEFGAFFASWAWSDHIIAHEIAHWADRWDCRFSKRGLHVGHGEHWLGWMLYLLADVTCPKAYTKITRDTLRNACLTIPRKPVCPVNGNVLTF